MAREQPRVQTNYPGWAILLGLLFVAVGAFLFFARGLDAAAGATPALRLFGVTFALAGLLLASYTWTGVRRRRLARRLGPEQPWRYDHPWNYTAARDETALRAFGMLRAVAGMALFLVPFHALTATIDDRATRLWFTAILVIFDIALVAGLGKALHLLSQRLKYGTPEFVFDTFPFATGGRVAGTLRGHARLADCELDVSVECIREFYEVRSGRSSQIVHERVHGQRMTVRTDAVGDARIVLELPADVPATDLLGTTPHYWELHVRAALPGLDYAGRFLLPVYADP